MGVSTLERDPLLTSRECAELVGVAVGTWRSLVQQGYAPKADDPGVGPVNRRTPLWRRSAVEHFKQNRPGRTGRPRKGC